MPEVASVSSNAGRLGSSRLVPTRTISPIRSQSRAGLRSYASIRYSVNPDEMNRYSWASYLDILNGHASAHPNVYQNKPATIPISTAVTKTSSSHPMIHTPTALRVLV